jgi:hypothetical protein
MKKELRMISLPNWVDNKILVIGKPNDPKLKELAEEIKFSFEKILPIPKELDPEKIAAPNCDSDLAEKLRRKYGAGDWYEWCNKYWGTKWDRSEYQVIDERYDNGEFEAFFMTAWSPPVEILKVISKDYDVTIIDHFEEEGYQSAGHLEFKNGEMKFGR